MFSTQKNTATIENSFLKLTVSLLGATVVQLTVKNTKKGDVDIALAHTNEQAILNSTDYLGSTVGRCANRIAKGRFTLNGVDFFLATNNGTNHLHGGNVGFDKRHFELLLSQKNSLTLQYNSCDGEENYSGNLDFVVKYSLTDNALQIDYFAKCDSDTLFNPTNHTYFNLNGHDDGSILDNILQINAHHFLPVDSTLIPTGQIAPVDSCCQTDTHCCSQGLTSEICFRSAENCDQYTKNPNACKLSKSNNLCQVESCQQREKCKKTFDFRKPKAIGQDISNCHPQLQIAGGFDHNFCLNTAQSLHSAVLKNSHSSSQSFNCLPLNVGAIASSQKTGIKMTVLTTLNGLQFYSGNFLNNVNGKAVYNKHSGFCLETQLFPDAINQENFQPKPILKKGENYHSVTKYVFEVEA